MNSYIWIFIVLFMIHEMEEIMGLPDFMQANMPVLREKYPFIAKRYAHVSRCAFNACVYEELILFTGVCVFSELTGNYGGWFALLAEFIIHLFIHILFAAIYKGYIPSVITSFLMLPPSIALLVRAFPLIDFSQTATIVSLAVFAVAAPLNLSLLPLFGRMSGRGGKASQDA